MAEVSEGDVLDGRYRIGPLIARGGMSSVHRATDLRLGRDVAAKVLKEEYAGNEDFLERLRYGHVDTTPFETPSAETSPMSGWST